MRIRGCLVEDIVYANARFDDKVAEAVEGMAGIEVPDAVARSIARCV